MTKNDNAQNRTLSIKKTFNAPVELVWEAWTQPGHIAHWWGPKGMEIRMDEHDFTFNVVHPTEAYCQQQEKMGFYNGWGSVFERLEAVILELR